MPNILLALTFWAFTYGLFAYRSQLRFGEAAQLFTADRFISTMVGAGIYWLVLSWLIDGTRNKPGKPVAVIATILPASIVMLAARVLLDQLVERSLPGFHNDLRFVMVWSGYFGLWVSGSLALRLLPEPAASSAASLVERPVAAPRTVESPESWAIVVDWLAEELKDMPSARKNEISARMLQRLGYDTADELEAGPDRGERARIVRRLASALDDRAWGKVS